MKRLEDKRKAIDLQKHHNTTMASTWIKTIEQNKKCKETNFYLPGLQPQRDMSSGPQSKSITKAKNTLLTIS